jgi:tripartite-type tricarboxylate transporter receptor subunit TctC
LRARGNALVIGLGTGASTRVVADAGFAHLDIVQLSSDVIRLSQKYFAPLQAGVLSRPNVRVAVTDGRNVLTLSKDRYDLIGMELTARAPADGYVIMMMSASFAATSAVQKPAFDPINAIVPVAEFGYTPFVLTIHPSLPAKTTKELIALARTTKGGLSYAGTGTGGATHLATELFSSMAKVKMVAIQYKSTGAAMADLLSGQVPVIVGSLLPVTPHLPTGRLRALAVTTPKRWHTLPNVPTIAETLPGYDVVLWFGTMAPRGTPQPIIDRLNAGINKALQDPVIKRNLEGDGMMPSGGTPQQFGERIRKDYDRWVKVANEVGLKHGS